MRPSTAEIKPKVLWPNNLDRDEWRQLQSLQRDGFKAVLPHRSSEEINSLVAWDDPDRYYETHLHPNNLARYDSAYANQLFTGPRVVIALRNNELVGFAYTAFNTSGESRRERIAKKLTLTKNYLWLREVAVDPGYHRQRTATGLARTAMFGHFPLRPVTTYVWPDELPFLPQKLEQIGFAPTGEDSVKPFGKGSEAIRQVRYQARTVRTVKANLT